MLVLGCAYEDMTTNAGFCAERGRVGAGECTWLYRVLHNSITYYTSCISCVEGGRIRQVDIAAAQQLLVPRWLISHIIQEYPPGIHMYFS